MTNTINNSFLQHFQAEVVTAYQQMGSKLRNTVRVKDQVQGSSTTFQIIGTGTAQTKTRNGQVPVMEVAHTPITCTLADYYAGEWIDSLDELKIGHDERRAVAQAGAYALGRKTDNLIITAMATSTTTVTNTPAALTKSLLLDAFDKLNTNDIPDDGERYALVGPDQWNDLLGITEFSSADYVGNQGPYVAGCETRKWLGINWIMINGLPTGTDGSNNPYHTCFVYHKNAVGLAIGMDIKTDITWHGDRAAHFINNMMSQGACLIDKNGVVTMKCLD